MNKSAFTILGRRMLLSLIVAAIAGTNSGCGNKDVGDRSVTIRGTVVDSLTKAAISGAWVKPTDTLLVAPWYTDSLGNYSLSILPASRLWLYVGKTGYKTKARYFDEVSADIGGVGFELIRDTL